MTDKFDLGVSKEDIKYLLDMVYKKGGLSNMEYKKALDKLYEVTVLHSHN